MFVKYVIYLYTKYVDIFRGQSGEKRGGGYNVSLIFYKPLFIPMFFDF